jgi:hypothetical protein
LDGSLVHRLSLFLILLLFVPGCVMTAPEEVTPSLLHQMESAGGEGERISLDDALTVAEPPLYLIIGREILPDGTAASWTILSADPAGGYHFLFITAEGVVLTRWNGEVPGQVIDPGLFPLPDEPVSLLIYPGVF